VLLHQPDEALADFRGILARSCHGANTGGGPFGTPVYQVSITFMRHVNDPDPRFNLEVWAGRHYPETYWVRNGHVFEAWLQRY
jgi:hypothetical protein